MLPIGLLHWVCSQLVMALEFSTLLISSQTPSVEAESLDFPSIFQSSFPAAALQLEELSNTLWALATLLLDTGAAGGTYKQDCLNHDADMSRRPNYRSRSLCESCRSYFSPSTRFHKSALQRIKLQMWEWPSNRCTASTRKALSSDLQLNRGTPDFFLWWQQHAQKQQ